ncbi:uncharacterized protein CANTADRAFT_8034 [Suhomyces tanzawaensis NRRL Y-17324]|uniref:Uncharacterized protein n=1 Tax=Suhomyces tanzawaensis NRRL Y-17324 TaxID=984487 RepID=A0A1E4SDP1_9ASCO|nr:uncharacterized protein CANTADRAFT_8034 [Suhomyces tanzawaensis NRRL Y-17324]ODV77586.1 hypothetical protein CANTADRAFT_8034 [Suhomyces tanzawaensis NRRL Y-17324]
MSHGVDHSDASNQPGYDQRHSYPNGFRDTLDAQERHRALQRERKEKHEEYRRLMRNRQGSEPLEAEDFPITGERSRSSTEFTSIVGTSTDVVPQEAAVGASLEDGRGTSKPQNSSPEQSQSSSVAPGLRYSRSAFDIMGAANRESPPAHKKQKVTGILGIELSEENISDRSTVSPLNGKINSMRLETPNTSRIEELDEE